MESARFGEGSSDSLTARQSVIWMDLFMLIVFYLSGALIPSAAINSLIDESKSRLMARGYTDTEVEAEYEIMRQMVMLRDMGAALGAAPAGPGDFGASGGSGGVIGNA